MKSRPIISRQESIIFEGYGNSPKYFASCKNDILSGYVLVTNGSIKHGDYFQTEDYEIKEKKWTQAIGVVGSPVHSVRRVCRPRKNKFI